MDSSPDPLPPSEKTSSEVASPSSVAQPSELSSGVEPWRQRFEQDQISAYDDALARWNEYVERAGPVYAKGQNTASARKFFREMDLRWRDRIRVLQGIEQAGLKEIRTAKPLNTRATSVQLEADGTGRVVINQCTDYRKIRYERNGKLERGLKPENLIAPLVVSMRKESPEGEWKVADIDLHGSKSCAV